MKDPHLISVDELRAAGALDVPAAWRKSLGGEPDLFAGLFGTTYARRTGTEATARRTAQRRDAAPEFGGIVLGMDRRNRPIRRPSPPVLRSEPRPTKEKSQGFRKQSARRPQGSFRERCRCPCYFRHHAGDAPALLTWRRFELADVFQALDHLAYDALALFDVGHFPPAENHRNDHLVLVRRNSRAWLTLTSMSWSPVLGRTRISLIFIWCVWLLCFRFSAGT